MSMLISAAIYGLNGAGSALGSPNGLSATPRCKGPMTIAASTISRNVNFRMASPLLLSPRGWRGNETSSAMHAGKAARDSSSNFGRPQTLHSESDPLQRAFGLNRDFRLGAR